MKRIQIAERPNWKATAEEQGFKFHTMYGEPYWDETSCYAFTLPQIENDIEDPATELHAMVREATNRIVNDERLISKFGIPQQHWDLVRRSWEAGEPELYGRFDFIYDGKSPAKMIEYNADTPTSLYEASAWQWQWLEEAREQGIIPENADQLNSIFEALVARFKEIFRNGENVHFSAIKDAYEDYATVEMMAYAAREAGLGAHYVDIEDIGLTTEGQFADQESRVIGNLFALYPQEDMLREEFAANIETAQCRFIEPFWKSVVSNKAILPVLWEMYPEHPNLLPSFFEDELASNKSLAGNTLDNGHVTKPIFSREGNSISIVLPNGEGEDSAENDYAEHPNIVQAYAPMPVFDGMHPVLGVWVVGETACGLGVREDASKITQDLSRFKGHIII